MKKSEAKEFFYDVRNSLNDYFGDYDCFWETETEILHHEATIYITIDYDNVPHEDVCEGIEDAVDNIGWDYKADWDDCRTYRVTIYD